MKTSRNPDAPMSTTPTAVFPSPAARRRRWQEFLNQWGLVVLVSAAALSVVAVLGEHVFDHAPGTLDAGVRAWALAHQSPVLTAVFTVVTRVGAPVGVFTLGAIVAVWLWEKDARYVAAIILAAPAVAVTFFLVVKRLIHRTRPAAGLLLPEHTFSFPSGHATASAAVFGTLMWVLAREGKLPWAVAIPLGVLCPLLIGCSRVYLDVHWTTDVLAGWCAGAAVAAVSIGVYERGRRRRARPT